MRVCFLACVAILLAGVVAPFSVARAAPEPKLKFHVVVPEKFKHASFEATDPEPVRYTKGYEAFWWNCVMVKAQDLGARCPFICSGTPAASYGCADGAENAVKQIESLLKRFPPQKVQTYLKEFGSTPEAMQGLSGYGYFHDGPKSDEAGL